MLKVTTVAAHLQLKANYLYNYKYRLDCGASKADL